MKFDKKPIKTNLLECQNCYRQLFSPLDIRGGDKEKDKSRSYFELQRSDCEDFIGIQEKLVEVDYPITSDYVNSFLPDTVYKKDLSNAANASGGAYRDLTEIQNLLDEDLTNCIAVYESTLSKMKQYRAQQLNKSKELKTNEIQE